MGDGRVRGPVDRRGFHLDYKRHVAHLHRRRVFDLHPRRDRMPVHQRPSRKVLHLHRGVREPHPGVPRGDSFAGDRQHIGGAFRPEDKLRLRRIEPAQNSTGAVEGE